MGLKLATAPAAEPVSTAEAKLYLRVDAADEDAAIDSFVKSARLYVEKFTRRALITQTWDLTLAGFYPESDLDLGFGADGSIRFPLAPVQSVTSLTYLDSEDGVSTVLAANQYILDASGEPAFLRAAYDVDWPETRAAHNGLIVRFVAGYGLAVSVPEDLKTAIKLLVGHWFEHREAAAADPLTALPMAVDSLLSPYRWGGYP